MFCPNCGANLPEGITFCSECGGRLSNTQDSAQQTYYAPQQPVQRPVNPVKKKEYLSTYASEGARRNSKLVLLTTLISVVLIVLSVVSTLTMPIFEIPMVAVALDESDVDVDELGDIVDDLEDEYEFNEDQLDSDEQEAVETVIDTIQSLVDNFSIVNIYGFMDMAEEFVDEFGGEIDMNSLDDISDSMDELSEMMGAAVGVIIGFFVLPLLFALLGGLNKSTGLTITALIFTAIAQAVFSGMLWVALSLAVYIFQAVLCGKINREYKDYRNGKLTVY